MDERKDFGEGWWDGWIKKKIVLVYIWKKDSDKDRYVKILLFDFELKESIFYRVRIHIFSFSKRMLV